MNLEELKTILPKYLSPSNESELVKCIKEFPNIANGKFYTLNLKNEPVLFQGDGLKDLPIVNLPSADIKQKNVIIFSNTCDVDNSNKRYFPSNIVYAPIIKLKSYLKILEEEGKTTQQISNHIKALKKQEITQILYLPGNKVIEESIVFLDKVFNINNSYVNRSKLSSERLFTLSDFGAYLFVFKLSLHFSRIQDKVERGFINH